MKLPVVVDFHAFGSMPFFEGLLSGFTGVSDEYAKTKDDQWPDGFVVVLPKGKCVLTYCKCLYSHCSSVVATYLYIIHHIYISLN